MGLPYHRLENPDLGLPYAFGEELARTFSSTASFHVSFVTMIFLFATREYAAVIDGV
jgi:hypothetical protein